MKNAVRFAAEEAGVPPSSLRIWLDMSSIPQTNPAVQKQVIASLPVFASVVDMFVVVAPCVEINQCRVHPTILH